MSDRDTDAQLSACAGKVAFESPALAMRVNRDRKKKIRREPYRCEHCGKWHLGVLYVGRRKRRSKKR